MNVKSWVINNNNNSSSNLNLYSHACTCLKQKKVQKLKEIIKSRIGVLAAWNNYHSNFSSLSNWKEEAWKKSGLQRDSNQWPLWYQCNALPTELWSHTSGASCQCVPVAPNVLLHSSVGRASHRYRRGYGFESRWSPDFFQPSFFQLLKLKNSLWWSLFTFIYNQGTNMNYFI